ncbi:MAG TPA: hypothetical protein VJ870_14290 [Amycolatopsis sp.]|nr:hypothetical protein [Amycolatopsis sp.]
MARAVTEIFALMMDKALGPLPVATLVLMLVSRRARRVQLAALALWVLLVAA